MFTALSERLTAVLKRVTGRGVLSEQDVTDALREIRRHLLEADVSFEVTQGFVERVRERAVAAIALKTVSPGQQVVKLVRDEIARMLGATDEDLARKVAAQRAAPLQFASVGPTVILLVAAGLGQDDHGSQAGATAQARAKGAGVGRGRSVPAGSRGTAAAARSADRCSRLRETGNGKRGGARAGRAARGGEGALPD